MGSYLGKTSPPVGPKGRMVITENSYESPKVTKDGVTVAKIYLFKE